MPASDTVSNEEIQSNPALMGIVVDDLRGIADRTRRETDAAAHIHGTAIDVGDGSGIVDLPRRDRFEEGLEGRGTGHQWLSDSPRDESACVQSSMRLRP